MLVSLCWTCYLVNPGAGLFIQIYNSGIVFLRQLQRSRQLHSKRVLFLQLLIQEPVLVCKTAIQRLKSFSALPYFVLDFQEVALLTRWRLQLTPNVTQQLQKRHAVLNPHPDSSSVYVKYGLEFSSMADSPSTTTMAYLSMGYFSASLTRVSSRSSKVLAYLKLSGYGLGGLGFLSNRYITRIQQTLSGLWTTRPPSSQNIFAICYANWSLPIRTVFDMIHRTGICALLLLLTIAVAEEYEAKAVGKEVYVDIKAPSFSETHYFDLSTMPAETLAKQWHAFVLLTTNNDQFWKRFHLKLSTVNKESKVESDTKLECHHKISSILCHIGGSQVNPTTEHLKVEVLYEKETTAELRIEIDTVAPIKLGEQITVQRHNANFTRLLRLDISQLKQPYSLMTMQMKEEKIVTEDIREWGFVTSIEEVPPSEQRFDQGSNTEWNGHQVIVYPSDYLNEVNQITILLAVDSQDTFSFAVKLIDNKQPQQLSEGANRIYSLGQRTYEVDLGKNKPASTQTMVTITGVETLSQTSNYQVNGKQYNKTEFNKILSQNHYQNHMWGVTILFNSTIETIKFDMMFANPAQPQEASIQLLTIKIHTVDYSMAVLEEKEWIRDFIDVNHTRYLYLAVDSRGKKKKINVDIDVFADVKSFTLVLRECKLNSFKQCKAMLQGSNKQIVEEKIPKLEANTVIKNYEKRYMIRKAETDKIELPSGHYQSLIIAEIVGFSQKLQYTLRWTHHKNKQRLKANQVVKGSVQMQLRTYFFTVPNATNIKFARVHLLTGGDLMFIGSDQLHDSQEEKQSWERSKYVYKFDDSVTFTNVSAGQTYYVYLLGYRKTEYELCLTYSYFDHKQENYTITYLAIGQDSRTHITLHPKQILFLQIRLDSEVAELITENPSPLRFCYFVQQKRPTTAAQMDSDSYCVTESASNSFPIANSFSGKRLFMGIQNDNDKNVPLMLSTETSTYQCVDVSMGMTHTFTIKDSSLPGDMKKQDQDYEIPYCVSYPLSHAEDIEVFIDIPTPKLKGIVQISVSIGQKYETVMSSRVMVIEAKDLTNYCQESFDNCWVTIAIDQEKEMNLDKQTFSVSVSYLNESLAIRDGTGRSVRMSPEGRQFKYEVHSDQTINVLSMMRRWKYQLLATFVSSHKKFIYPTSANQTGVMVSNEPVSFRAPSVLRIEKTQFPEECKSGQDVCYLLINVLPEEKPLGRTDRVFEIEIIQHIGRIREGKITHVYLPPEQATFYTFRNLKEGNTIMFMSTQHVNNCSRMSVFDNFTFDWNHPPIDRGENQVIVENANKATYTLAIITRERECSLSIQVATSAKPVYFLQRGIENYFDINDTSPRYYLLHVEEEERVKMISSMFTYTSGQVILRGMPVPDDKISSFLRYISGESVKGLKYQWTGINHLTVHKKEGLCQNCYFCVELTSAQPTNGALLIPYEDKMSFIGSQQVAYDVLAKGEQFSWLLNWQLSMRKIIITVVSGSLTITVTNSEGVQVDDSIVKFTKNSKDSTVQLGPYNVSYEYYKHSTLTLKAEENTDYKITSRWTPEGSLPSDNDTSTADYFDLESGRPIYIYTIPNRPQCLNGSAYDPKQTFGLNMDAGGYYYAEGYKANYTTVKDKVSNYLKIQVKLDNQPITLEEQYSKNTLLLNFKPGTELTKSTPLEICFSQKSDRQVGLFFFRLGQLTYLPQNSTFNFRKASNLTFMSHGDGVIELDQCTSKGTIMLTSRYDELNQFESKVKQQRRSNNLIYFTNYGETFLSVRASDWLTLRWRSVQNYPPFNGYGYELFMPGSFLMAFEDGATQVRLKIQPISQREGVEIEAKDTPRIKKATYQAFVSRSVSDLYSAMNCARGDYLYWVKEVQGPAATKPADLVLTNTQDLKSMFRWDEQIFIIVKAVVVMEWPSNNAVEDYRFYYPYTQVLLPDIVDRVIVDPFPEPQPEPQEGTSFITVLGYIFFFLIVVALIGLIFLVASWAKRRYLTSVHNNRESVESGSHVMSGNVGTELEQRYENYK